MRRSQLVKLVRDRACLHTLLNRDQSLRSSPIYFNGVLLDLKWFDFGKFVLCFDYMLDDDLDAWSDYA